MEDILTKYSGLRGRPGEMAMLCALLRERGLYADAFALGEAAIAAAPHSLAVRKEVCEILGQGVPPFHRPMLLDDARNRAYADAIASAVRPGMKVLEIGCGAGLLAMMAARAGAQVVTCEANPMIAAAATEIVRRNAMSDRVRVIPKLSTDLRIPEDLDEPADLVIHEIFGAQLFDEGVTAALADARKRLLKPGAPSIPAAAAVRFCLLRSEQPTSGRTLSDIEGFDLSAFELLTARQRWHGGPAHGLVACSEPATGLRMDFDANPPFGPSSQTVAITSHGGLVEKIVQWFRIELADGNVLENDPISGGTHSSWGAPLSTLPAPFETKEGDVIDVTLRNRGKLLTFDAAQHAH